MPPPRFGLWRYKSPGDADGDHTLGITALEESLPPPGDTAAQMKEQGEAASVSSPQPLAPRAPAQWARAWG